MRTTVFRLALCALASIPRLLGRPLGSTWIELTFPFNNKTIYWPGDPTFKLTTTFDNYTSDGYYLFMSLISAPEHGGTHLDAPRHYAKGKWSTDEIPLGRLIGSAIKVDISSKAAQMKFNSASNKRTECKVKVVQLPFIKGTPVKCTCCICSRRQ